MSKAADMAKVSAKGSFHSLWGLVISTLISSVGTIFIARLLGSDLYGLYGIILNVPNIIAVFRDWGMHNAIVRYTAQYRSDKRETELRSVLISGAIFELILGIALTIVSILLSSFIANNIYNRPEITQLIQIASITIFANGLIALSTATFTGVEKMQNYSIMLILQSIFKTALIIILVVLGLSTPGAIIGYTIACIAAGIAGVLLTANIYRKLPKPFSLKLEIKEYTKEMLKYGIPLSVSTIIISFLSLYYSFLVPYFYPNNSIFGNYSIATTFVVLILFFSSPITTMLFPAFSKLDNKKDHDTLKNVFQFSVKYASLIVLPVATLVMCLSEPAVTTLFGHTYDSAPLYLALLAIAYLFTAVGNLSINNLLSGQGQTKLILKTSILTATIGFPMGYILIMQYAILGLITTQLTAGLPSLFLLIYWVKKNYKLTVDWKSSARIFTAAAIPAILTYLVISFINYSSLIELIIGVFVFALILVPAVIFTKAITRMDIANLLQMTSGLGPLGKILSKILNILDRLITIFRL